MINKKTLKKPTKKSLFKIFGKLNSQDQLEKQLGKAKDRNSQVQCFCCQKNYKQKSIFNVEVQQKPYKQKPQSLQQYRRRQLQNKNKFRCYSTNNNIRKCSTTKQNRFTATFIGNQSDSLKQNIQNKNQCNRVKNQLHKNLVIFPFEKNQKKNSQLGSFRKVQDKNKVIEQINTKQKKKFNQNKPNAPQILINSQIIQVKPKMHIGQYQAPYLKINSQIPKKQYFPIPNSTTHKNKNLISKLFGFQIQNTPPKKPITQPVQYKDNYLKSNIQNSGSQTLFSSKINTFSPKNNYINTLKKQKLTKYYNINNQIKIINNKYLNNNHFINQNFKKQNLDNFQTKPTKNIQLYKKINNFSHQQYISSQNKNTYFSHNLDKIFQQMKIITQVIDKQINSLKLIQNTN